MTYVGADVYYICPSDGHCNEITLFKTLTWKSKSWGNTRKDSFEGVSWPVLLWYFPTNHKRREIFPKTKFYLFILT